MFSSLFSKSSSIIDEQIDTPPPQNPVPEDHFRIRLLKAPLRLAGFDDRPFGPSVFKTLESYIADLPKKYFPNDFRCQCLKAGNICIPGDYVQYLVEWWERSPLNCGVWSVPGQAQPYNGPMSATYKVDMEEDKLVSIEGVLEAFEATEL
ncbi:hypothetical protein T440DRAFT_522164 [Plenodomus tracheiphilus IPT5]|uniref:Uncharacterized protein n=1 Tax=Plenodomus tracheiphilus IPT5 TaxID=1408161 RepID=A0A6A7AS74_9PLEO|nr:hypothetical protein T440DRAFT_522164 [Plenodomus tracheiphilus IPT5]